MTKKSESEMARYYRDKARYLIIIADNELDPMRTNLLDIAALYLYMARVIEGEDDSNRRAF